MQAMKRLQSISSMRYFANIPLKMATYIIHVDVATGICSRSWLLRVPLYYSSGDRCSTPVFGRRHARVSLHSGVANPDQIFRAEMNRVYNSCVNGHVEQRTR